MRRFCCILLSISLIFCAYTNCFAAVPSYWSSSDIARTVSGIESIDSKMSNVYTALSNIYTYITNNGNGIREGISALYTNSNTTNDRLQYLINIGYAISGYLEPLAGDGKNIAQQLYDIRTNQLSIGGQVGDVSSKLVTTNNTLSTIGSRLLSIQSNTTNLLSEVKLYWQTSTPIFNGLSTDGINYSLANASGDIVYAKVTTNLNINDFSNNDSLLKIVLPIVPNLFDYVEVIVPDINNSSVSLFLYDTNSNSTTFYCRLLNTSSVSSFIFAFHMKDGSTAQQRIRYTSNGPLSIHYTTNQYTKYYDLLADLYTLKNSQLLEDQTTAIRSLANEFNGSNGIIQDDSDTVIVVDFDSDTGSDVSNFIYTIQDFFDTGVSIGELTLALNSFSQMPWFTSLETYNTVNSQGAYYKDLYND